MGTKFVDVNTLAQHNADMQRYALYVSRYRAIPDYRDGLKPVQRRILFAMWHDLHAVGNTKVKSARITGTVIGNYNPHGDQACYDAMKPMVNWFETMIPYLNKQGSFGNFQGDDAAHMRYTEASLNKFAMDVMIGEMTETPKVVNWTLNYTGTEEEPDYLPAKLPVLLINGSFGVAVGFKIYIPRHNINEVIDATLNLIDNPDSDVVLVPDTSMKCEIVDTDWKSISNKGRGMFKVRGLIDIEEYKGHPALIIKSLPDHTFLNSIIDQIEDLINKKQLPQIHDLLDESKHETLRYVIVLKKNADANYVREVIYKSTNMTKTFSVNFEVLDGINPIRMSYRSYLTEFIKFRMRTKFRLYRNKIQYLETKKHERELYIRVLESGEINNIIKKIRSQKTIDDNALIEYLIKKLDMTDLQAKFILNTNLSKLSMAYLNKYKQEYKEMDKLVKEYTKYTIDDNLILEDIKRELLQYKETYGKKRNSKIIKASKISEIPGGTFTLIVTENNFIRKIDTNIPITTKNGAAPKLVLQVDNRDNIVFADEFGKVYKLPIHMIPFTDRNSPGIDIRIMIKNLTSNIIDMATESWLKEKSEYIRKWYIIAVTKHGYIKRIAVDDFIAAPMSGITFIKLEEGDSVQSIVVTNEQNDIIVYSHSHALRLKIDDIPYLKRTAKGLRSMDTDTGIDGMTLVPKKGTTNVIVVTKSGKANKFNQVALPVGNRATKGKKVIKLGANDIIASILTANDNDTIIISTANVKSIPIAVADIPVGSSISAGKKIISTRGDTILSCTNPVQL